MYAPLPDTTSSSQRTDTPSDSIPSLLISRFILSLRGFLSNQYAHPHATSQVPTPALTRDSLRFAPRVEILGSLGAPIDLTTFDGGAESYEADGEEQHNYEPDDQYPQLEPVPVHPDGAGHRLDGAARSPGDDGERVLDHALLRIDITDDSPLALGLLAALYADMIHRAA